jgi:archaemetzincin
VAGEAALHAEALELQPVASLASGRLQALAARLSRRIELPVHLLAPAELALRRINGRDQIDAGHLLELLEARATNRTRLLVGVTGDDVAVPIFTFVFGLARQGGRACLVSLARTDPEFYGLPPDPELRDGRAVCEVLHELGHLASLEHCANRTCLMSFAGNIEKVDTRGSQFCDECTPRLPHWLAHQPTAGGGSGRS